MQNQPDNTSFLNAWKAVRSAYCERFYPRPCANKGINDDGSLADDLWEEILKSLNKEASPGVDGCYRYRSNKDYVADGGLELRRLVEDRLRKRLEIFGKEISADGLDDAAAIDYMFGLVEEGILDPTRIFNKDEPTGTHKETRIVNSVSVEDSCCERATTLRKATEFAEHWTKGPSTVGIQLKDVEAMRGFREDAEAYFELDRGFGVENTDVQGWEWAFRDVCHKILFEIEFYIETGKFPDQIPKARWSNTLKLLHVEYVLSLLPRMIVLSNGEVLFTRQIYLQSGRFKTSFGGTHVRSVLCTIVCTLHSGEVTLIPAKSNGDDCLNRSDGTDFSGAYKEIGFVITDRYVAEKDSEWSFCSHKIFRDTHYPESISKLVVSLLRNPTITSDLWDAFTFAIRERPDYKEICDLVGRLVPPS